MRAIALALALLIGVAAMPAAALDLEGARASGLVGETPRGYIAPIQSATPDVAALVRDVNQRRRDRYEEIARTTGSSLEAVEVIAAERIRDRVPAGTYILGTDGRWQRK